MTQLLSTLRKRWHPSFFVLLAWAILTAWVALAQTAFASQEQEKAEMNPSSVAKNDRQRTTDDGQRTNDHTAFTYQGQLKDANGPVSGAFDLQFILYSAQTGGVQLGSIDIENLALTNGLFSVRLDFGRAVLEATESWLEVGVRPGGSSEPYTVLFPRQKLTPTPYAIFAQHEQWSLIGVPVGFAPDRNKHTDIISVDEKKISMSDVEASLAKLAEKAITPTTPDDRAGTVAANSAVCAQPVVCDSPDPNPAFSATNQNRMGTAIVGLGGVTGGYFQATGSSGTRVGAYGVGDSLGVWGRSDTGTGVFGSSASATFGDAGVSGRSDKANTFGTRGYSVNGTGAWGHSENSTGVFGSSASATFGDAGVSGRSDKANTFGTRGWSTNGTGVWGHSDNSIGVLGDSSNSFGVFGRGPTGVYGQGGTHGGSFVGNDFGVYAKANNPNGVAGFFDGKVSVAVAEIRGGGDLAEPFAIEKDSPLEPGTVMVIDTDHPGKLAVSRTAYDRKVAGIISGAGGIKTGMLMSQSGSIADGRYPVALTGRVYCWADASYAPIEPGDLLTTSDTPGHAMKVTDHAKAQGAIIGKAMTSLKEGKGLVLVLVTLQ